MNEFEKQILFVLGTLDGLVEKGLMTRDDNARRLTASGMEAYRGLAATGYRPTSEELESVLHFFVSNREKT